MRCRAVPPPCHDLGGVYDEAILLFCVLFLCLTLASSGREQTVVRLVSPDHPRPEKDRGRSAYVPMVYLG